MSYAPQSSPGPALLPACALALFLVAAPLSAQTESIAAPTDLHRDPDGTPLVELPAGAPVETGSAEDGWQQATVEGWIYTPSVSPTRREGFDLVVSETDGENLRESPNGPLVGRAREGTLLERVGEKGKWTRVRREGWVPDEAVKSPAKATPRARASRERATQRQGSAPAAQAATPAAAASPPAPTGPDAYQTARETGLNATPGGPSVGTIQPGTPARVLSRSGEWARVRVEGWMREDDLLPDAGGTIVGVSAAEVRASPDRYVGKQVDWRLQVISVQVADDLRPEMEAGEPYLLTRGPLPEPGFVYVVIPPEQVARFRALSPLHEVVLRVTIKAARTRYLATPVTEMVSVVSGLDET